MGKGKIWENIFWLKLFSLFQCVDKIELLFLYHSSYAPPRSKVGSEKQGRKCFPLLILNNVLGSLKRTEIGVI